MNYSPENHYAKLKVNKPRSSGDLQSEKLKNAQIRRLRTTCRAAISSRTRKTSTCKYQVNSNKETIRSCSDGLRSRQHCEGYFQTNAHHFLSLRPPPPRQGDCALCATFQFYFRKISTWALSTARAVQIQAFATSSELRQGKQASIIESFRFPF